MEKKIAAAEAASRTTTTKLRKVLEFWTTDIPARTLGETHVSTDELTKPNC